MEENNYNKNYNFYRKKYKYIAGVDEVGRGPLAGAVVAAAVILPDNYHIDYLDDSKKMTERRRELAYEQIKQQAISYALGRAESTEIDQINILQASLVAMARAINSLAVKPDVVLIDGNFIPNNINMLAKAVIKGDKYEAVISAAAILAKVTRDREMYVLDQQYPEYGFAKHKGYPTKTHLQAIETHGVLDLHRKSFAPIKKLVQALI